jgi:DNA-directed RNA polymerases I, II, and III subunit RPABC2
MADDDYEEFADDLVEEDEEVAVAGDEPHDMLLKFHPETVIDYAETVLPSVPLQVVPAGATATVYERTKVLGTRANQIADGARPFIVVPDHLTDPLEIAKLELEQRRLPFIIKRPMPDGTFEYWRLSDLMII